MKPLSFARRVWTDWVRPLLWPLLVVTAVKSSFADINYVPTGSMKPTILEGDVVFVNKLAYDLKIPFTTTHLAEWSAPARGDIVVCFAPDDGTRLVKRVVALPGDTVELRNNVLLLNGVASSYQTVSGESSGIRDLEPAERNRAQFAREILPQRTHLVMALPAIPALRNFGPILVPAGQYFMMGDNRDNSRDSRYFGPIAREKIVGQAKAVVVSANLNHWLRPRLDRFFAGLN